MTKTFAVFLAAILVAALVLYSMTYTVQFHEVAIRTRFGKTTPDSVVKEPGLQFKMPLWLDVVTKLDTRLQIRESAFETVQTKDGQILMVRAFLTWRVDRDNPVKFHSSYGSFEAANTDLGDRFRTALRNGLSRFTFNDLIGPNSRIPAAEEAVKAELASLKNSGIDTAGVGFSQLVLPQSTTKAVLTRMQTTRSKISENERDKGNAIAAGISSRAATQADKIRTFANLRAQEIRAQGDRQAAQYLAKMGQEQELAIFLSWIDALQATLSERTTLIIPTSFAPFHMMHLAGKTDGRGIPQPAEGNATVTAEAPPKPTAPSDAGATGVTGTPAIKPADRDSAAIGMNSRSDDIQNDMNEARRDG